MATIDSKAMLAIGNSLNPSAWQFHDTPNGPAFEDTTEALIHVTQVKSKPHPYSAEGRQKGRPRWNLGSLGCLPSVLECFLPLTRFLGKVSSCFCTSGCAVTLIPSFIFLRAGWGHAHACHEAYFGACWGLKSDMLHKKGLAVHASTTSQKRTPQRAQEQCLRVAQRSVQTFSIPALPELPLKGRTL